MSKQHGVPHILIVDDEPENLNLLEKLLREEGYSLALFTRAEPALAAARAQPPDVALLDVRLPGMSGLDLCARMKAEPRLADIPVIFISALSADDDILRGFQAKGVDYVTKPIRAEEVLARVHTHTLLLRARRRLIERTRELEASLRRAEEAEQLRDDCVHFVIHDMRSPLQGIMGNLELIATDDGSDPAETREIAEETLESARRLAGMIENTLVISRLEAGKLPLALVPVNLAEITRKAWKILTCRESDRLHITVTTASPPVVSCDYALLERVLINLLDNAVKYSPPTSTIDVRIQPVDGAVRLEVQDRGPVVPADRRRTVFTRFGRTCEDSVPGRRSHGFGLPFCKLAVEAHDGQIGVEPGPEQGNCFWFLLPQDGSN